MSAQVGTHTNGAWELSIGGGDGALNQKPLYKTTQHSLLEKNYGASAIRVRAGYECTWLSVYVCEQAYENNADACGYVCRGMVLSTCQRAFVYGVCM